MPAVARFEQEKAKQKAEVDVQKRIRDAFNEFVLWHQSQSRDILHGFTFTPDEDQLISIDYTGVQIPYLSTVVGSPVRGLDSFGYHRAGGLSGMESHVTVLFQIWEDGRDPERDTCSYIEAYRVTGGGAITDWITGERVQNDQIIEDVLKYMHQATLKPAGFVQS